MTKAVEIRQLEGQIEQLLAKRNPAAALPLCEQLNRGFPGFARGWYLSSQVAMHTGNPAMARIAIERAIDLEPDNPGWMLQLGLSLAAQSDWQALMDLLTDLNGKPLTTPYQCSTMGSLLCQVSKHAEAVPYYQQAHKAAPRDYHHAYNLACLYRSVGELELAETVFDETVSLNPADYESYKLRSDLRKQTPDRNHVQMLQELLTADIDNPRDRVQIMYALAKELEDLEKWSDSFRVLADGAALRRSLMKYDVKNDLSTINAIQQNFDAETVQREVTSSKSDEPIFILGMPRTGTTLVERILSNHSDVYSAGELTNFSVEMMKQAASMGKPASREALVEMTTRLDFQRLGDAYIQSTRPMTGHTARFIDKLPLNYLYVGLIRLALPGAKIIILERHPVDTCYSIYKQLFMDAYPFSYDLEELGHYYVAYDRLMKHWRTVLPDTVHVVQYEELVGNLEGQTRQLLDYCNLPFEPACVDFTSNSQASTTASAAQVRQPVYKSSVGKWTHYQEQLQPLIRILESAGIDCAP